MTTEITFEGDVSLDDYRYMVKVDQETHRFRRLRSLFLCIAVLLTLSAVLGSLTGFLIGCGIVAVCLVYLRFRWRSGHTKGYAMLAKIFLGLQGHLNEDGVKVTRTDSSISEYPWHSFTELRRGDSRILLFMKGSTYLVLSKSMFASEAAWQAACSLIEAKLSAPTSEGDINNPVSGSNDSADGIPFSGHISSNQLFIEHALQIISNKYMYLVMFIISLPALPFLLLRNPIANGVVACVLFALPVLLLGVTFLSCYVLDKNRQKREKIVFARLTADDIDITFSTARVYRPLTSYENYQRIGDLLYLYYTKFHYNVLHRNMFQPGGDWEQALAYVSGTVPDKDNPEPAKPPIPPNGCSECGKDITPDNAVQFGDQLVCAECKPRIVQKIKEGVYNRESEKTPSSVRDNL